MNISMNGKIHETANCRGPWLNTIEVRLADGRDFTLDRDTTEYSVDGSTISMDWFNVYSWDGWNADYNLNPSDFKGCKVIDYYVEEDADDEYRLQIEPSSLCFY